ncbi:MAG: archaetidylserine decarboxylase [Lysobacter sp.]|nr:archaetidylserine decarboxylase [Lysobacter sp.]
MTARELLLRIALQEDVNFLLTNRVPRQLLTRFMGWFSRIERPLVRDASIAAWRLFADLDLSDARRSEFRSLHDCFTRELKEGARPIDPRPAVLTSPCDGIVGACGAIAGVAVVQAKGFPYTLADLLGDGAAAERYRGGCYATLRITSSMYHRFHSPADAVVREVNYISGDTWNVNPIALARIERLFCKNERAAIEMTLDDGGQPVMLVAVAAILVAGIRLHFADVLLHLRYRGPNRIACEARLAKGEEMGWFEHGSTIIVFAPRGLRLCEGIGEGVRVRAGEPLLRPAMT